MAPTRWARVGGMDVDVDAPVRWTSQLTFFSRQQSLEGELLEEEKAGRRKLTLHCGAEQRGWVTLAAYGAAPELPRSDRFRAGGPFVGIGAELYARVGLRMRYGYEVAYPSWVLYSLSLDTNYRNSVTVAPVAEIASAGALGSFSLGAGAVVRVRSEVDLGARVQAGFQVFGAGLVASMDLFPGEMRKKGADPVNFLLLARFSL